MLEDVLEAVSKDINKIYGKGEIINKIKKVNRNDIELDQEE